MGISLVGVFVGLISTAIVATVTTLGVAGLIGVYCVSMLLTIFGLGSKHNIG